MWPGKRRTIYSLSLSTSIRPASHLHGPPLWDTQRLKPFNFVWFGPAQLISRLTLLLNLATPRPFTYLIVLPVSLCAAKTSPPPPKTMKLNQSYGLSKALRPITATPSRQKRALFGATIRLTLKKNNMFANITNLKGQTIIKFSSGLIQKKKNKKQLRLAAKWIISKIGVFVKNNFFCVKVIVKGHGLRPFSYFKELKRKNLKIVSFKSRIPVVHNGCRPPKKRRI